MFNSFLGIFFADAIPNRILGSFRNSTWSDVNKEHETKVDLKMLDFEIIEFDNHFPESHSISRQAVTGGGLLALKQAFSKSLVVLSEFLYLRGPIF